jgi:vitamin B12 transporter
MHRSWPFLALLVIVLLAVPGSTRAASTVPSGDRAGALKGVVRTTAGQPLSGIVLDLVGPEGSRTVVTGPEGRYAVSGLPAGDYQITVSEPGFVLQPEARANVGTTPVLLDLVLAPAPVREQVVVAATRTEAAASTLGTSVTVLDREAIASREASSFLHLVQDTPGVAVARTGALGASGSMFVRGGESNYARVLVDGVPVNQPGGGVDFGSALPFEYERLEVVRGAASTLYGTDALAGVVEIVTRRADAGASPDLRLEGQGGNFGTWQGGASSAGRTSRFDWNAGIQRLETDNDAPNSAFAETAGAASLGATLGADTTLRVALRAEDSTVGTPGQTAFGRPDLDASFEQTGVVFGAQLRHVQGRLAHRVQAGLATTHQLSLNPQDSGCYTPTSGGATSAFPFCDFPDPDGYQNDTSRYSLGYMLEAQAGTRNLLNAGVDLEHETGEIGARSGDLLSPERTNAGVYVQDRLGLGRGAFLTLGGRIEHNDNFGWKVVPRAALAVRLGKGQATTLRASAGTGIKEPSFLQSFGVSFYAQGNPDLKAERSVTFDAGIDQRLLGNRLRAEVTYFHHDYKDQIAYTVRDFTTFEGTYVNLGETRAQGLEVALQAVPVPGLTLSAVYTFTDGEVVTSSSDFDPVYAVGQSLLRRPKNQGSFTARVGQGRVSGAFTFVAVGQRTDSDFAGIGLLTNPGYTRVDARLWARIKGGLEAFLVAENLFDEEYQEALGYPALGRSVRGGLRLRLFGASHP